MRTIRTIAILSIVAVSLLVMGFGPRAAEAGNICIDAGYVYDLTYVPQEGRYNVIGYIQGMDATCSGMAYLNSAGHIIIGLNTAWKWEAGGSIYDPTSVVYIDLTAGTYDITYFGDSESARDFQGTASIVPCGLTSEAGLGGGQNDRK